MSRHRSNRSSGKAPAREAGNLEVELHIKLGAPVVLTKNISFEDGKLVDYLSFKFSNLIKFLIGRVCGAMGTVSEMHQFDGSVLVTLFRGTLEQRAFRKSTEDIVHLLTRTITATTTACSCQDPSVEGTYLIVLRGKSANDTYPTASAISVRANRLQSSRIQ